jgi:hypothetical protein
MSTNFEGPSWPWVHRSPGFEVLSDDGPDAWPSGFATKAAEQVSGEVGKTAGAWVLTLYGLRDLYGCTFGCIFNNSNVRTSSWLPIPATAVVGVDILPLTTAILIRIYDNCRRLVQFAKQPVRQGVLQDDPSWLH